MVGSRVSKPLIVSAALVLLANPAWASLAEKPITKCAQDAVVSGRVCMDTWEATVWRVPDPLGANKNIVKKIQQGKATAANLAAIGATQLGAASDDYAPCLDSGQNCANDIYAVSLPGVTPSRFITWFQAQAACENSLKGLPSNAEWQGAVIGTPDLGADDETDDCNTHGPPFALETTGSRTACVSARGAFDMVGSLYEWVADWVPRSTNCGDWDPGVDPTNDDQCFAGAATTGAPGALIRGGGFNGIAAGPLLIHGDTPPSTSDFQVGFRCAR